MVLRLSPTCSSRGSEPPSTSKQPPGQRVGPPFALGRLREQVGSLDLALERFSPPPRFADDEVVHIVHGLTFLLREGCLLGLRGFFRFKNEALTVRAEHAGGVAEFCGVLPG